MMTVHRLENSSLISGATSQPESCAANSGTDRTITRGPHEDREVERHAPGEGESDIGAADEEHSCPEAPDCESATGECIEHAAPFGQQYDRCE